MSYSAHNTPRKKQRTSSDDDTNPLFEFIKERKKQDPKRTDENGDCKCCVHVEKRRRRSLDYQHHTIKGMHRGVINQKRKKTR